MKTNAYRIMGTTRDRDTCECCGKQGLKKTVMLQWLDEDGNPEGDLVYFGSTCAAHAVTRRTGQRVSKKEIDDEAELANAARTQLAREREFAERNANLDAVKALALKRVGTQYRETLCIYRTEHDRREEYADFPPVTYSTCFPGGVKTFTPGRMLVAVVKINPSTRRAEYHPTLAQEAHQ